MIPQGTIKPSRNSRKPTMRCGNSMRSRHILLQTSMCSSLCGRTCRNRKASHRRTWQMSKTRFRQDPGKAETGMPAMKTEMGLVLCQEEKLPRHGSHPRCRMYHPGVQAASRLERRRRQNLQKTARRFWRMKSCSRA